MLKRGSILPCSLFLVPCSILHSFPVRYSKLLTMKHITCFLFYLLINNVVCGAQKIAVYTPDKNLLKDIQVKLGDVDKQYRVMMNILPPGRFPKTFDPKTGKLETSNSGWWCSGFYPGTLLTLFEQTKDTVLYNEAL